MKLIISLDSLADRINMHDLDCNFKHFVRPKSNYAAEEVVPNDIIIFSFAWSERQQRVSKHKLSLIIYPNYSLFSSFT